jgi:hypothetical protein
MRTTAPTNPAKSAIPWPPLATRLSAPAVATEDVLGGGVVEVVVPLPPDGVGSGEDTGGDTMTGGTVTEVGMMTVAGGSGVEFQTVEVASMMTVE